jgi:hypothetical protein
MRKITGAVVILAAISASLRASAVLADDVKPPVLAGDSAAPLDIDAEVARLRAALGREVPYLIVDTPSAQRRWFRRAQAEIDASDVKISRPQLVVVVDRNPRIQQMRIVLASTGGSWQDLGGTKVSTGQTGRRDYYVTPTGVFLHTDAILDWRAEGTYNENHIRGLGVKGMRVWDFGWQRAVKGWGKREEGEIRLLLHATDPANLERRLGHAASKGCVRIPEAMNRFLDRHGILDADYERAAKDDPRFAALSLPNRVPTPLAGDALVIVDSSMPSPVAVGEFDPAHRNAPTAADRPIRVSHTARGNRPNGCS